MIMVFSCSIELSKLRKLSARILAEEQYLMSQAAFEELRDEFLKSVLGCDFMTADEAYKEVAAAENELAALENNTNLEYYCTLLALKRLMDEQIGPDKYYFPLHALYLMMTLAIIDGSRISGDIADYYNRHCARMNICLPGVPRPSQPLTEDFVSSVRKFMTEADVTMVLRRLFKSDYEGETNETLVVPYFYLLPPISHDSDMYAYGHTTVASAAKYAASAMFLDFNTIHDDTSTMEIAEHILTDDSFSVKDKVICIENFERPWEVIQMLDTFGGYYVARPFCSHAGMLDDIIKEIFDKQTDLVAFKCIRMRGLKVQEDFEVQVLKAQNYLNDNVLEAYPNVNCIIRLRHSQSNRRAEYQSKDQYASYLSNIEFNRQNKPEKPIIASIASSLIQDSPHSMLDLGALCSGRFRTSAFDTKHMCMDPCIFKLIHECVEYIRNTTPAEGLASHSRTKPEYNNLMPLILNRPKIEILNDLCAQIVRRYAPDSKVQ